METIRLIYVISLLSCCFYTITIACKGCVNLDEYNFEKIIPRFEAVLVKFDVAYPYGDKHETYTKFAEELIGSKNVLIGEMGIKDYGDNENKEFAKKFGIKDKSDLPVVKLFLKDINKYVDFPKKADFTIDNLRNLLRDNTNLYIGLPGCLEQYDKLAIKFAKSNDKEKVLQEMEKATEAAKEEEKSTAKTYMVFMKKIIDQGLSFIQNEIKRLTKIINEGKVNDKKKLELTNRLNILHSFKSTKDEL